MGTFVLVHGDGHGGWCWPAARDGVAPLLRVAGHDLMITEPAVADARLAIAER